MRLTPDKKLHSRQHLLADDLAALMGEPKKFAAYLGIAKRYCEADLRGLARRVREKEDLPEDARGKYFFAALRGMNKIPIPKKGKKEKHGKRKRASHRQKSR